MNHDAIAHALCGRYVRVGERVGYLESSFALAGHGALIGAYIVDLGDGSVRITDDGDTLFNIAKFATEITRPRRDAYRAIAESLGFSLGDDGAVTALCAVELIPTAIGRYVQALSAISSKALQHRPKDADSFERLVGQLLEESYGTRMQRRVTVIGLSGHQLQFPFGIDMDGSSPSLVQPIAAQEDATVNWRSVYEAAGKFDDVRAARNEIRPVVVLEKAANITQARRYLADKSDVYVYESGPLMLRAA